MKRLIKLCGRYYSWLCYGISAVMAGSYIFIHTDYLDDPRVTPPPPHTGWVNLPFIDDGWFGVILILTGIVLVAGVVLNSRRLRNAGLIMLAPMYGLLATAFILRGLFDFRFNLTWLFALLALALMFGVARERGVRPHER